MKTIKYIYLILLFLGWSGLLYAQTPKLIGVVNAPEGKLACFQLTEGTSVKQVSVQTYSMVSGEKTTEDATYFVNGNYCFAKIPENPTVNSYAYEFQITFADGNVYQSSKYEFAEDRWFDWLGSDVKWTDAVSGIAGREPCVDEWYSPFPGWEHYIGFNKGNIFKALVTCADGYFFYDFPENTPYDLLKCQYGVGNMDPETGSSAGSVKFAFTVNEQLLFQQTMYAALSSGTTGPYARDFETSISGGTTVKMAGDPLGNPEGDVMIFALPRVYLKKDIRQPQNIDWFTEKTFDETRPFEYTLTAKAASGQPVCYRIVYGEQYATLKGDVLNITSIPENDYIEVEAFHPGNETYAPTDIYRCRFTVSGKKVVSSTESYVLKQHEVVKEIVVKGDKESVGQLSVERGAAKVEKLTLQYTFIPGEWNFISFPSNADLAKITDLEALGYAYNQGDKAFYILEYNTKKRAESPDKSAWTRLDKPVVTANQGYIMGVSRSADNPDNTPVTVTFTFDNLTLDLSKEQNGEINVDFDFYEVTPGSEIPVYIRPANGITGNNLKIHVKFEPKNRSELAMNYAYELEQSRITFNPNRSGIRITLPTSEQAKVLIFDENEQLVKAVCYESPYLIDIRDLEKGTYQVLIQYGNAREFKKLVVE